MPTHAGRVRAGPVEPSILGQDAAFAEHLLSTLGKGASSLDCYFGVCNYLPVWRFAHTPPPTII